MICVHCGMGGALEGNLKHPYCEKCWKFIWKGSEDVYADWLGYYNSVEGNKFYEVWLNQKFKKEERNCIICERPHTKGKRRLTCSPKCSRIYCRISSRIYGKGYDSGMKKRIKNEKIKLTFRSKKN